MKKKFLSIFIALVLVLSFSLVTASPVAAVALTYYVATDGSDAFGDGTETWVDIDVDEVWSEGDTGPWQTIQNAIDTVQASDTIIVKAGTYQESISVTTASLTLRSVNGRDSTIIENVGNVVSPEAAQCGFLIRGSANDFTLGGAADQGFNFSGGTSPRLIQLNNAPSGVEISYNTVNTTGTASTGINIGAAGATDLTVSNNIFIADEAEYQDWPLIGPDTTNPVLNVTVTGNEFTGSGTPEKYGAAICLGKILSESTIAGNTISAFDRGIIISAGSSGLHVSGNDISNCGKGVLFRTDTHAEMESNTFASNTYNIYHAAEILTGGSSFYGDIQDAIDNADLGDTIQVYAGTYAEEIIIGTANLTLQSESELGAIIRPTTTQTQYQEAVIRINADGVTIDGFEIDGTTVANNGICGWNTSGLTIKDNKIHGAVNMWDGCGILLMSWGAGGTVYDNLIEGNEVYDTGRMGIMVMDHDGANYTVTSNNTITGNIVYDVWKVPWGDHGGGIQINVAKGCSITNNEVYDVRNEQRGIYMFGSAAGNIIENNTIRNNPIGIQLWISGDGGGPIVWGGETATSPQVHFNNIYDNTEGAINTNIEGTIMVMDAERNWWGAAKGPGQDGANPVSVNVDYSPWLGTPYPEVELVYPVYIGTTAYETIQEAVDDASPGDTLIVGPGTYFGEITVSENLTLSAPDGAKLTGTDGEPVVTIGDVTATLEGFEIDPGIDGVYIPLISDGNVVTIQNLIIYDNTERGIEVDNLEGTLNILNNIISQNGQEGIDIAWVDDGGIVVIQGNKIGAWEYDGNSLAGNGNEGIYIHEVLDGSSVTIGGATQEEANLICENGDEGIYVSELYYGSTLTIEGNVVGAFAYDGYTFDGNDYGVYIDYVDYGSTVTIRNNAIAENSNEGIYIEYVGYDTWDSDWNAETEAEYYALFQTYGANDVTIAGNMVVGNGAEGIYVYYMDFASTLTIQDNAVSENYEGIYVAYYGNESEMFYNDPATYPAYFGPVVLVKGNTITDNEDYGIYCDQYDYGTSVTIEGNTISGNLYGGIYHCCGPYTGSSVTIRGNTIVSNGIDGWNGGIYMGDCIREDSSYTVEGNFIAGNWGYGVYIYEVYDNSSLVIRGNTIGASTRDGMSFAGNDGYGIYVDYVYQYSTADISRNTIAENTDKGIVVWEVYDNGSVDIINNNVLDNGSDGIAIWDVYFDGSADIHYNNIVGNNFKGVLYMYDSADEYVDATSNWWGDASGPSDQGPGTGDKVSTYVHFSPWLTSLSVWEIKATLDPGWVTLSTPIALDSATDELAEMALDMAIAYAFYEADWVLITDDNDTLAPCDAFFVKMNGTATIDLVPNPEESDPPTRSLSQGWNLVGLANLGNMSAEEALTSAYLVPGDLSGYAQIVSPSVNMGSWSYLREGPDAPEMLPTEGYWVFMTNAGTLAGFTFTPIQLQ